MFNKNVSTITISTIMCALLSACGNESSDEVTVTLNTPQDKSASLVAEITVTNPSLFKREQQATYISYYNLGLSATDKELATLQVKQQQKIINSQAIDTDYDGNNDGLIFLSNLAVGQSNTFSIIKNKAQSEAITEKLTQAEISHKVEGEWVPHTRPPKHKPASEFQEYVDGHFVNVTELTPPPQYTDHSNWIRYEGPGIESDKVGYRIYLDWRNGFDIFGKKTTKPALQNVGIDDYESYHHMADWGMDILKVGGSLGAGGFGLWSNDKLSLVSDVESWQAKIQANGDLYSAIQINYQGWQNSENKQDLTANISMQGGSRLAKVNLALTKDIPAMAVGVVKHKDTTFIKGSTNISGYNYTYIASWGKQSLDESMLGMAVFFKKGDLVKITQDDKNYLAVLKPKGQSNQQQVDYYFSATWQVESGIATQADFIAYLEQEAEQLTRKPRIQLKTVLTDKANAQALTADNALHWGQALADSELSRKALGYHFDGWDVNRKRKPKFEYDIIGMQPLTFDLLADVTGNDKYRQVIEQVTASFVTETGEILAYKKNNYNIDNIPPGRNFLRLYQRTKDDKFKKAAAALRLQLVEHPKTSKGAFWHKKKYTSQLWLDGVYMGMPFLAEYAMMFETGHQQEESLNEVVNEFKLSREYLRDSATGLYFHGWDELKQQAWANKDNGLSPEYWARGLGWLTMAIVDVLDSIPAQNVEQRKFLIEMVNELAVSIANTQDKTTGAWWQIMDKPAQTGNYQESSATAMFAYFYAKALNNGYLDEKYRSIAVASYQALINQFTLVHADGSTSMTNQCYVAGLGFGRDGSFNYYMNEPVTSNDPKGTSPYILASMEMYKLLSKK